MKSLLTIFTIALMAVGTLQAQDKSEKPIEAAIAAKQYTFKARTVMPASGSTRPLNSDYDFTISHDSAISYLPYFGRAYQAPIGRTDNGLNFTSTDFSYTVKEGKKGGWMIQIRPKDAEDVQLVSINVSKAGYGTLHVNSRNRQAISYSGKIEPLKKGS
jgi:hypothetical protein